MKPVEEIARETLPLAWANAVWSHAKGTGNEAESRRVADVALVAAIKVWPLIYDHFTAALQAERDATVLSETKAWDWHQQWEVTNLRLQAAEARVGALETSLRGHACRAGATWCSCFTLLFAPPREGEGR